MAARTSKAKTAKKTRTQAITLEKPKARTRKPRASRARKASDSGAVVAPQKPSPRYQDIKKSAPAKPVNAVMVAAAQVLVKGRKLWDRLISRETS